MKGMRRGVLMQQRMCVVRAHLRVRGRAVIRACVLWVCHRVLSSCGLVVCLGIEICVREV